MMCTWRGGGNIDSETDHKTSSLVLGRHEMWNAMRNHFKKDKATCNILLSTE